MAFLQFAALILAVLLVFSISPSFSLTCTSQKFTKPYDHCVDLPQLNSYLHWTYNSSASSLSMAFVAPPAQPDGWVAWAINPTGSGMPGAQALVAFKDSSGKFTVKTFNLISYFKIVEAKLSIDVKDISSDSSDGNIRIFATWTLPDKKATTLNQAWQVGRSVTAKGFPAQHDFQPANLQSFNTLDLLKG